MGQGAVGEITRDVEGVVCAALGRVYRLTPLAVKCTYPVFRGEAEGAAPIFVKLGPVEEWRRSRTVRSQLADCGLVAPFLTESCVMFGDLAVSMLAWAEGRTVFPEDMTDAEVAGFVDGCVRLAAALRRTGEVVKTRDETRSPETLHRVVADYAKRHPLAARLLGGLPTLPPAKRAPSPGVAQMIHGDFHAKNFAFCGDKLGQVFDLDQPTEGLPCSDLLDALVERFSVLSLSRSHRQRLCDRARKILRQVPWPRAELETAINILRLRFAARRIAKHPNSAWVAVDIARRDRKICEVFGCLP